MRSRSVRTGGALALVGLLAIACTGGGSESVAPTSTVAVPEVLAAAVEATASADDIVVGAVLDLTGTRSGADIAIGVAVDHEVARVDASGGIVARGVVLAIEDSLGTVVDAARAADELVDRGAVAIVVGCDSDQALAAASIAEGRGVLVVAPCAVADALGAERPGSLTFQLATPAAVQGRILAEHVAGSGITTAATVAEVTDADSLAACAAFGLRFVELGGLLQVAVEISGDDLPADQVGETLARFAPPGVVVSCVAEPLATAVSFDLRRDGSEQPLLATSAGDIDSLVAATPGDVVALGPPVATLTPEQQALLAGGGIRGAGDLAGVAAVEVIRAAIELAGGPSDGPALAAALEAGQPIATVIGSFTFSAADHAGAAIRSVVLRGHVADGSSYVFERTPG